MNAINKLAEFFSEFPGIGGRQSKRFVYFLLTRNQTYLEELSRLILLVKKEIKVCTSCFRFFPDNAAESAMCDICRNKNRDTSELMIVSRDVDLENIEKTHSYSGLYFVLGGTVPILEKEPEKRIRAAELKKKVEASIKLPEKPLKEIILGMNLNPEGENTGEFIKRFLSPLTEKNSIKVSTLGRGLSTGTELEYSDSDTISNALKNRV